MILSLFCVSGRYSRTIRGDNCGGVDCIGYRLHGSILAADIITWHDNVAMEATADFYAVTLDDGVSANLYLPIG
jgi:hypothetical protein